jgi:hypothetical protein
MPSAPAGLRGPFGARSEAYSDRIERKSDLGRRSRPLCDASRHRLLADRRCGVNPARTARSRGRGPPRKLPISRRDHLRHEQGRSRRAVIRGSTRIRSSANGTHKCSWPYRATTGAEPLPNVTLVRIRQERARQAAGAACPYSQPRLLGPAPHRSSRRRTAQPGATSWWFWRPPARRRAPARNPRGDPRHPPDRPNSGADQGRCRSRPGLLRRAGGVSWRAGEW